MIDAESLRPTASRQLDPKQNEEDRAYLDEVHKFIDQEYDKLFAEIGEMSNPRTKTLGKDWIEYLRRFSHHQVEESYQWGPAYRENINQIFDRNVVGTLETVRDQRKEWKVEGPVGEIPKRAWGESRSQPSSYVDSVLRHTRGY